MAVPITNFYNNSLAVVTSGGTDAPAEGTQENWTVSITTGFSSTLTGEANFHVADPVAPSEKILVTAISGSTWTVIRGDESTTPVTHTAGFSIMQVVSANELAGAFLGYYNVRAFGALGDGSTNDTTAIQNAMNSVSTSSYGGTVFFPPGKYVINSPLTYASTTIPLRLQGHGSGEIGAELGGGASMIYADITAPGSAFEITGSNTGATNMVPFFSLSDLGILCTGANSGGSSNEYSAVYMEYVYRAELSRLQIQNDGGAGWQTCVHAIGNNTTYFEHAYVNAVSQCIWMDGGSGMTLFDIEGGPNTGSGYGMVRMDDTSGVAGPATIQLYDCVTEQGDWGFYANGGSSSPAAFIYMNNVQVNRPHVGGLYFGKADQVWLDYVWISDDGLTSTVPTTGILLDTDFEGWFYMENSVIQGCWGYGMQVNACTGAVIANTSFGGSGRLTANTYDELNLGSAASNITVTGCHFDCDTFNTLGNARSAIYCTSGATNILVTGCMATTPTAYGTSGFMDLTGPAGQTKRISNVNMGSPDHMVFTQGTGVNATTTTYTVILGPYTIPAYDMAVNTSYRVTLQGALVQAATAANFNLAAQFNGHTLYAVAPFTDVTTATADGQFIAEAHFRCVSTGPGTGTGGAVDYYVWGQASQYQAATSLAFSDAYNNNSINTTIANTVNFAVEWTVNTGSANARFATFERIDPIG